MIRIMGGAVVGLFTIIKSFTTQLVNYLLQDADILNIVVAFMIIAQLVLLVTRRALLQLRLAGNTVSDFVRKRNLSDRLKPESCFTGMH